MKRLIAIVLLLSVFLPTIVYAVGEGNVEGGGGGMGNGTSTNKWIPGEEGVRVTVVRVSDGAIVSTPFDMASVNISDNVYNFGSICKLSYRNGLSLVLQAGDYTVVRPTIAMPQIISTGTKKASIDAIKRYFCSEYAVQLVANISGIPYDTLIGGNLKVFIEPIAYFIFNGKYIAMSATQAALYDQEISGGLRSKMLSLSHKNLPLAMFLEIADLGYPAWSGSTSNAVPNETIINQLGLGIVRFNEDSITPNTDLAVERLKYRADTDVITSIKVSTNNEYNPDAPLTVTFKIAGNNYVVKNIVIPKDESQLVWVKWHTPSTPQNLTIRATYAGRTENINVEIENLVDNEPPDPKANDRNDTFTAPSEPNERSSESLSWGVWSASWHAYWVWHSNWQWNGYRWVDNGKWVDEGWYDFTYNPYEATLSVNQYISPDSRMPVTISGKMKSGYGFNTNAEARVITSAGKSAYTQAQTSVMYFPEFKYKTYFRVLDKSMETYRSSFKFKENRYSTYKSRAHFTPIWYPDGAYKPYTKVYDAWTPAGMLQVNKTSTLYIQGNLFSDWHIAPKK